MANEEQLKRLKQGVREWNVWRGKNPEQIDLSRADLTGADLSEVNLTGANLTGANLTGTNLGRATFHRRTDLTGAYLSGADLTGANLSKADLSKADLTGANLSRTNLIDANLSRANLSGANLTYSLLSLTVFAENNLTSVKGLDTIRHQGPSRIDFRTVIFPAPGSILTTFLRGAGSSEYFIEALNGRSLPFQPVSVKVFISFASSDQSLCQNLRHHLSLLVRLRMIVLSHEEVLTPDIHQWEEMSLKA